MADEKLPLTEAEELAELGWARSSRYYLRCDDKKTVLEQGQWIDNSCSVDDADSNGELERYIRAYRISCSPRWHNEQQTEKILSSSVLP